MENTINIPWPPNLIIKKHPRARRVKFKSSLRNGLELILPPRFNMKNIPILIEENRAWLEKQLLNIASHALEKEILPKEINLRAIHQVWKVEYLSVNKKLQLMVRPHVYELALFGKVENSLQCKQLLIRWLKEKAKRHLCDALETVSKQINLPFQSVTIRDQLSRWGSCSSKKVINLNYKLLFLPYELMNHVLIHELCHTIHLNHSDAFWDLVASFDVNNKESRRLLRQADRLIPSWL